MCFAVVKVEALGFGIRVLPVDEETVVAGEIDGLLALGVVLRPIGVDKDQDGELGRFGGRFVLRRFGLGVGG